MNWTANQIITTGFSVAALCLGILNFVLARRTDRIRNELQKRNDQLEIGRLLDRAWDALHGGDGYHQTGNITKLESAESLVDQASLLDPHHARVIRYQGYVLQSRGNKAAAAEKYKQGLARNPRDPAGHNALGLVQEGEDALASFDRAIKCDPTFAIAFNNAAKKLEELRRLDEAEVYGLRAVELEPSNVGFLVWLARYFKRTRNRDRARDFYERVISVNPHHVEALVELGATLCETGEFEEGVAFIEHAMRIDPKDAYPHGMLGAIYHDRGESEEALKHYEAAIHLDPKERLRSDPKESFRGVTVRELAREVKQAHSKQDSDGEQTPT